MYTKSRWIGIILVVVFTSGCSKFFADLRSGSNDSELTADGIEDPSENPGSTQDPQSKKPYKNGKRATREDFIDQSQEEGSLWASSGQTNYYFTKNKVRSPGDIVTVKIENDLYRGIVAEIKKSLSSEEKVVELIEAKEQLREKLLKPSDSAGKDSLSSSAAAPEKTSLSENAANPSGLTASEGKSTLATSGDVDRQVMQLSMSEVDISSSLEIKTGDLMMGEIMGRYPNGNYKIRATKKVLYKKGPAREVIVLAIVKATDLGEDTDAVTSGKLYDYQVEVAF